MQITTLNGIKVHYKVEGPAGGLPVVFSNSLGTDFRIWDEMISYLPDGFRIIRYDTRGHGLSEAPDVGAYFMGDLVKDAAALLDHLDIKNAVFIGLSIGGMIAQGLAAERPDLLRAMVLMDTATKIGNENIWNERVKAVRKGGITALESSILERWFSKIYYQNAPDQLAGWRHMLCRTPQSGYIGCCLAIADTDLYTSTARLSLPTLAVVGSEDGSTPPDMVRETADLITGCQFEVIRRAGHLPCIEQPEITAELITNFMKENGIV